MAQLRPHSVWFLRYYSPQGIWKACIPRHPQQNSPKQCFFSATGWLPYRPAPPVYWLACIPGHTPFQALSAQSGPAAGEVAGAVRWERGTHCGPLPVSTTKMSPEQCSDGWQMIGKCFWLRMPVLGITSTSFIIGDTFKGIRGASFSRLLLYDILLKQNTVGRSLPQCSQYRSEFHCLKGGVCTIQRGTRKLGIKCVPLTRAPLCYFLKEKEKDGTILAWFKSGI